MTREWCFDDSISGVHEFYVGNRREILSLCNHLSERNCWVFPNVREALPHSVFGCFIYDGEYSVYGANLIVQLMTEVRTVVVKIGGKKFRFTGNAREAKDFIEAKRQECKALYGFGWWNYFTVEV